VAENLRAAKQIKYEDPKMAAKLLRTNLWSLALQIEERGEEHIRESASELALLIFETRWFKRAVFPLPNDIDRKAFERLVTAWSDEPSLDPMWRSCARLEFAMLGLNRKQTRFRLMQNIDSPDTPEDIRAWSSAHMSLWLWRTDPTAAASLLASIYESAHVTPAWRFQARIAAADTMSLQGRAADEIISLLYENLNSPEIPYAMRDRTRDRLVSLMWPRNPEEAIHLLEAIAEDPSSGAEERAQARVLLAGLMRETNPEFAERMLRDLEGDESTPRWARSASHRRRQFKTLSAFLERETRRQRRQS